MNTFVNSQSVVKTMLLNAPCEGAIPVAVVRYDGQVNLHEYGRSNVTAVIPAWKMPNGQILAVKDGKKVATGSAVWDLSSGDCFRYDDGARVLLSRELYGKRQLFFISGAEANKDYLQVHRAFVKEIKKKRLW